MCNLLANYEQQQQLDTYGAAGFGNFVKTQVFLPARSS